MYYELWDTDTRNLIEDFHDEGEALAAAAEYIELNPSMYPANLALARGNDDGTTTWLASGAALGERAARYRARAETRTG